MTIISRVEWDALASTNTPDLYTDIYISQDVLVRVRPMMAPKRLRLFYQGEDTILVDTYAQEPMIIRPLSVSFVQRLKFDTDMYAFCSRTGFNKSSARVATCVYEKFTVREKNPLVPVR